MKYLINYYDEYYGNEYLRRWRELSAFDKATNIISAWSSIFNEYGPTLIEIGCGDGSIISELIKRGFGRYHMGVEVSKSALKCAKENLYSKSINIDLLLYDGSYLPVRDKSFDLAVLSHVLEHVECPRALLIEARRIARYVFVEVPLELNLRTPRNFKWTDTGHINLFNMILIRQLIQQVGMQVLVEHITCPRREVFNFRKPGFLGLVGWVVKKFSLAVFPAAACCFFTYNGSILALALDQS
ncbi:MAG: class I SAM-dependent methyltransferase [candidate division WOR-3 bacterium]